MRERGQSSQFQPIALLTDMLKWMMGFVLAFQLAIFAKLFMH